MSFIALTHNVGSTPKSIYVNVDQICSVGDAIDAAPVYRTMITLANGAVAVVEPVATVMQIIADAADKKSAA
jgi:hypothetical protein